MLCFLTEEHRALSSLAFIGSSFLLHADAGQSFLMVID
jgi:hypothetical protein